MARPAQVHLVHPGNGLQCTTYLIVAPEGAILVDPGSGIVEDEVVDGIRRAGVALEQVRYALLTHCHVDHALGAYRFRERGVQLVASARTAEILRCGGYQVWYEFPDYVIPTEVDCTPADGETLDLCGLAIRAVATPGHTDGCMSYLFETDEGLTAFTGDLLMNNGRLGWSGSEGFSVESTLASLEKLLMLAPQRAYWGHGIIPGPATDWLQQGIKKGRAGRWRINATLHTDLPPPAQLHPRHDQ